MYNPVLNIRGRRLSAPYYIWGIVNTSPDSFHDGGLYSSPEKASIHAKKLWLEGANILDIGGVSSRPGAQDVSAKEEFARILPVIEAIQAFSDKATGTQAPKDIQAAQSTQATPRAFPFSPIIPPFISIDTWRHEVAHKALEAGIHIINDISAFSWDPALLEVVSQYQPAYVLMHCQGRPQSMQQNPLYSNVVDDVLKFFEEKITKLVQAGLPEENIILDPGIGFGKTLEHNLELLRNTERLQSFGRPLLLGVSHKSLFGKLLGLEPEERTIATQVCTALMAQKGYTHHRVHDVKETFQSLELVMALSTLIK